MEGLGPRNPENSELSPIGSETACSGAALPCRPRPGSTSRGPVLASNTPPEMAPQHPGPGPGRDAEAGRASLELLAAQMQGLSLGRTCGPGLLGSRLLRFLFGSHPTTPHAAPGSSPPSARSDVTGSGPAGGPREPSPSRRQRAGTGGWGRCRPGL